MAVPSNAACVTLALVHAAFADAVAVRPPVLAPQGVTNRSAFAGTAPDASLSSVRAAAAAANLSPREKESGPAGGNEGPGALAEGQHSDNDSPGQDMWATVALHEAAAHPRRNENGQNPRRHARDRDARKVLPQLLNPDVLAAEVVTSDDSTYRSAWVFLGMALGYSVLALWYECILPREAPPPGLPGQIGSLAQMDSWDLVNFALVSVVVFAHFSTFVRVYLEQPVSATGFWYHAVPYAMPSIILVSGVRSTLSDRCMADTLVGLPCTVVLLGLLVSFMSRLTPGPKFLAIGMSIIDWYLMALFCWRLAVGPAFALTRCRELPTCIPFTVVFVSSYFLWQRAFPIWEPVGNIIDNDASFFAVPWHLWVNTMPFFALGQSMTQDQWQQMLFGRHSLHTCSALLALYTLLMVTWPGFREWWSASCVQPGQCTQQLCAVDLLTEGISGQSFGAYVKVFLQKAVVVLCIVSAIGSWGSPLRRHAPRLGAIILGCGKRWVYIFLLHWVLFCMPAARAGVAKLLFGEAEVENMLSSYIFEPVLLIISFATSVVMGLRLTETLFCWLFKLPGWVWACCFLPASYARGRRAGPPASELVPERKPDELDEDEGVKLSATAWLASLPKTPGFLAGRPRQQARGDPSSSSSSSYRGW